MMAAQFLIDDEKVAQLAATRQGRLSYAGFSWQVGYAVMRLAEMVARESTIFGANESPIWLRYDWAEDLDEIDQDGNTIVTQCKTSEDILQPGKLAKVMLGFAPKWVWTDESNRDKLIFRLVCTREAGENCPDLNAISAQVKRHFLNALEQRPGVTSDRALWQKELDEGLYPTLFEALWNQLELRAYTRMHRDEDHYALFEPERDALNLLVQHQKIHGDRQREVLGALRALIHRNAIDYDMHSGENIPRLKRKPLVMDAQAVALALHEYAYTPNRKPIFQVITDVKIDQYLSKPAEPYDLNKYRWDRIASGPGATGFIERDATAGFIEEIESVFDAGLDFDTPLPVFVMTGPNSSGKTTLAMRVAVQIAQKGQVVVAAPRPNLQNINCADADKFVSDVQSLCALQPVLLLLDDPFFDESNWMETILKLAQTSTNLALLVTSPSILYDKFGPCISHTQVNKTELPLERPSITERQTLARTYGKPDDHFDEREEAFIVLLMEAVEGEAFDHVISRMWRTVNGGEAINPNVSLREQRWEVHAFQIVCAFHRFDLPCPFALLEALLGARQNTGDLKFQLERLRYSNGWQVFVLDGESVRTLGVPVAERAWAERAVPAYDLSQDLAKAAVTCPEHMIDLARLAVAELEARNETLLRALVGAIETDDHHLDTRTVAAVYTILLGRGANAQQVGPVKALLERRVDQRDSQSWIALQALYPSSDECRDRCGVFVNDVIRAADFGVAQVRGSEFISQWPRDSDELTAIRNNLRAAIERNKDDLERARQWCEDRLLHRNISELLRALITASDADQQVLELVDDWLNTNPPMVSTVKVISTAVARSDGAQVWLDKAEAMFRELGTKGDVDLQKQLIGPLVTGGKAQEYYIDMFLDFIDAARLTDDTGYGWVMHQLSKACVNNLENAFHYIEHGDKKRQFRVARAAAIGVVSLFGKLDQEKIPDALDELQIHVDALSDYQKRMFLSLLGQQKDLPEPLRTRFLET